MDRRAGTDAWRRKDRVDLEAALGLAPPGLAEAVVRQALDLFDLADAATSGARRVAPLGPPSRTTSTAEWMEDLRQDLTARTSFEQRALRLRPDLVPGLARLAEDPAWPAVRAGVARVVTRAPSSSRGLLELARRLDRGR